MPRRPVLTLEFRKLVQKLPQTSLGMILIPSHLLKIRSVKVKTTILVRPFTTHADPQVAKVSGTTVDNQPAAQEEVDAQRTIRKSEDNINNATIKN